MALIILINIIVVVGLVALTTTKGLERALPFFVFVMVLCPKEAQIPIPNVFLLTTWRVAIAALAVLYVIFPGPTNQGEPLLKKTPLKVLIGLHVIWCVVSTVNSFEPLNSVKQIITIAVEYYLLYYILTRTITSIETVNKILAAMVIAVAIATVFGAVEAYTSWRVTQLFPDVDRDVFSSFSDEGRGDRIISTFSNYSLFGAAVAFAMIEVFYFLQFAKRGGQKFLLWATLLLMFLVIYKTMTRGPWLALIMGAVLLLMYSPIRTRKTMLVIAGLCVVVCLIRPGVFNTIKGIYAGTVDTNTADDVMAASYQYRWALWRVAADELAKEPLRGLWGYGMGTFWDMHIVAEFNGNPNFQFQSCDEAWVLQLIETGYVGLLIVALVLLTPAVLTLRNAWKLPKPQNFLCWVLLINMLQYYFMMANVEIYGWAQTGYMLWTWIALAMVYPALVERESKASQPKAPPSDEWEPQLIGLAG